LAAVRGVGAARAETLAAELAAPDWRSELAQAERAGVRLVTFVDPEYPAFLKEIHDPPLVLYVQGDPAALGYSAVAVVGTRSPTMYGRETARRLSFQLAQAGVTVVSGLARGIDTEAHMAALQAKGRTVAVIGSALDAIYPAENRALAARIAAEGGAVVSEYPFGRQADRQTFPMRNRIVSGLCGGVLVVEAGLTSGTLITANQALEQGRSVLAVPGRIDSPSAQGCHRLIRQGAKLAESLDDILEELQTLPGARRAPPSAAALASSAGAGQGLHAAPARVAAPPLDEQERKLLEALGDEELSVDALIQASGLPAGAVGARLMGLEMKRLVRRLPGQLLKAVRA
jgi:DNA processing protein